MQLMDDDLMSLRGGQPQNNRDDDLFGSFSDPDDLGFDAPPPPGGGLPDLNDPFDFTGFDEPTFAAPAATRPAPAPSRPAPASAKPAKKTKAPKPRRRRGPSAQPGFMGLTPPQMMVLSIFLFLDVAVFGFFVLVATGAIAL